MTSRDTNADVIEVRADEWARLQGEDMMRRLEGELENRLRRRFSFMLVVVAVLSFFGIQALAYLFINQQLAPEISKAKDAAAKANAEAELVSRTTDQVLKSAGSAQRGAEAALKLAKEQTVKVNVLIEAMGERADKLDERFDSIEAVSENVRAQLELSVKELQANLSEDTKSELIAFKENSKFEVHVAAFGSTPIPKGPDIVKHLRRLGFKVSERLQPDPEARPTKTNEVLLFYTEVGKEKLKLIVDELRKNFDIEVRTDTYSSGKLSGDIQITFQQMSN